MRYVVASLVISVSACGGGDGDVTAPPTTGTLEVTTSTAGVEADPDGYTIQIDAATAQPIGTAATLRSDLPAGSHTVALAGLAPNCAMNGQNPRTVSIVAGETASVSFAITCSPTMGSLTVTTSTTGESPDADGYVLMLDGADRGALPISTSVTLSGLSPGSHVVGLSGIAGNCQLVDENLRAVVVTAGATATVSFAFICTAPPPDAGAIRLITATSEPEPDPDGYTFAVDGGTAQPLGASATITVDNLSAGTHSVRLAGIAANCALQGTNPRAVTIIPRTTVELRFTLTCSATTGSIQITVVSTGSNLDPDGYALAVDGGPTQPIAINASLSLSGVAPGAHSVALSGVATNCTVGQNPQPVTVSAGAVATVQFSVSCEVPALRWQAMESGTHLFLSAVWGSAGTDVYAVGEPGGVTHGTILHYDGQRWSAQITIEDGTLGAVWGASANNVFAAGGGTLDGGPGRLLHNDGTGWSGMTGPDVASPFFTSIWGSSGTDVFAAGGYFDVIEKGLVAHFDGNAWSKMTLAAEDDRTMGDVHGTSPHDVWAVGQLFPQQFSVIAHFDGNQWVEVVGREDAIFAGVWANSPTDVFAVGSDLTGAGLIFHYDGQSWEPMLVPRTGALLDAWGTSGSNVYAVAGDAILHYDGSTWTKVFNRGGRGIWGSSATDVFVVGADGLILHGTP